MKTALALLVAGLLAGCDWYHSSLMNGIPFSADVSKNPDVYVYIAIDGLSHQTVKNVQARGHFTKGRWSLAKFITMFPGTSDASWSRILKTNPIPGYEFEHYDPERDEIQHTGIIGFLCHAFPTLSESVSFDPRYYRAFDFRGNGFTHVANAYASTSASLAESLDNFFYLLDGRSRTSPIFTAYFLELDVLGHMQNPVEIENWIARLAVRLEDFRRLHPRQRFHFTILSDHGMDFTSVPYSEADERLVPFDRAMRDVGLEPVERLEGRDFPYAVLIQHVIVTYLGLHTSPTAAPRVAERVSQIPSVDLTLARLNAAPRPVTTPFPLAWYALYSEGKAVFRFGYDEVRDQYYVLAENDGRRVQFPTVPYDASGVAVLSDEQAFDLTRHGRYPDLLFRVRTALAPVSVKWPAQVLVSFKRGYASRGTPLPGGSHTKALAGFHGSLDAAASVGTLLTEERVLPEAVRSDSFLDLFPRFEADLRRRGIPLHLGDTNAPLFYP